MLVLLQASQKQVIWLMKSVSVDQGGQVIRVDIPNGDGTFTTLEGEEAQKWYDKAGEEDQQEAAEEASTQSIEDVK